MLHCIHVSYVITALFKIDVLCYYSDRLTTDTISVIPNIPLYNISFFMCKQGTATIHF